MFSLSSAKSGEKVGKRAQDVACHDIGGKLAKVGRPADLRSRRRVRRN
jgi:hypothetical protein